MSIFLKCEDAQKVCDKNQYKEAGFLESIKLSIHLIFCRICQKYTARNNKLTKLFKSDEIKTMPRDAKTALKERLQREMTK